MHEARERPPAPGGLALPLTLLLALGAPALCAWFRPDLADALALGAVVWAISVGVKLVVARLPGVKRLQRAGTFGAAAWGAVSAACELGLFAAAVWGGLIDADVAHGIAAGVGAGALEIVYLLASGILAESKKPADIGRDAAWRQGAQRSWVVAHLLFVERFVAMLLHVGARACVASAIATGALTPGVFAFIAFAAVDGEATRGAARGRNWFDPAIAHLYYAFVLLAGGACLVLALLWR